MLFMESPSTNCNAGQGRPDPLPENESTHPEEMTEADDTVSWTSDDDDPEDRGHNSLPLGVVSLLLQRHNGVRNDRGRLKDCPKLPVAVEPLAGDLRQVVDYHTSDNNVAKRLHQLRSGFAVIAEQKGLTDPMEFGKVPEKVPERAPEKVSEACASNDAPKPKCFLQRVMQKVSNSYSLRSHCRSSQGSSSNNNNCPLKVLKKSIASWGNVHNVITSREMGLCRGGGFCRNQQRHVLCNRRIPAHASNVIDEVDSRAYIGQFSKDGTLFVAAFQDRRIHLYDVDHGWRLRKNIAARMLRWTITDTALSPDGRFLLYSSITPIVHLVNVGSSADGVESLANVTDIHDALYFGQMDEDARFSRHFEQRFGIWSIAWSGDGREIVAGTNDKQDTICVYNVEERKPVVAVQGHTDDVNAVAFLDESANVFVSGSDDSFVKVWDRRALGQRRRAAGILVGHTEGITHLDCKGDGRYLISNSKDQTIKLWDIRKVGNEDELSKRSPAKLPHFHWDYRWNRYPGEGYAIVDPNDVSVMTYRGHSVLQTLIRAYFSPVHNTGQRYIYTGSQTGSVHVFDIVTAEEVERMDYHASVVRDCSWHPTDMTMASVSWDGRIVRWEPQAGYHSRVGDSMPKPAEDKYDY